MFVRVQADVEQLRRFVDGVAPLADELRAGTMQLECALASFGEDVTLAHELRAHAEAAETLGDFVSLVASRFEEAEAGGWTFSYADTSAAAAFAGVVFRSVAETTAAWERILEHTYRPGATVGSGSPADALRFELEHEVRLKTNTGHYIKVEELINRLRRIQRSPHLDASQRAAAERLLQEMRAARDAARELARSRGTTPTQLLKGFRRVESPAAAMRTAGVPGVAAIGSALRAAVGYFVSPMMLLMPTEHLTGEPAGLRRA